MLTHKNSASGILTGAVVLCTAPCQRLSGSAVLSSSLCVCKSNRERKRIECHRHQFIQQGMKIFVCACSIDAWCTSPADGPCGFE